MTENTNMTYDPFENAYYVQYDLQGGEGNKETKLLTLQEEQQLYLIIDPM